MLSYKFVPIVVLNGVSPYEKLTGNPPSVKHLRVFGCLCFAKALNNYDSFSSRFIHVALLGCSMTQKGYNLLNLDTNTLFVSRNVQFKEDIFPFKLKDGNINNISASIYFDEYAEMLNDDPLHENVDSYNIGDSTTNEVEDLPSSDNLGVDVPVITEPRKSSRISIAPSWQQDYIMSTNYNGRASTTYPISNCMPYDHLLNDYK